MKRILGRVVLGLTGAAAIVYASDWLSLTYRIPGNRQVYSDIRVDQIYTSLNRYNEIEYSRGDPVMERCVWSLLPHGGYRPCWYVTRHTLHTNKTY
ncbi:MAG: hypothetical protein KGN84_11455 [Acidobacteriota bacterium]|nr:hypothetical protein [Acidobacteriota bacterium]